MRREKERKKDRKRKKCCLTQERVTRLCIGQIHIAAHNLKEEQKGKKRRLGSLQQLKKAVCSLLQRGAWQRRQICAANEAALLYPALPCEEPEEQDALGKAEVLWTSKAAKASSSTNVVCVQNHREEADEEKPIAWLSARCSSSLKGVRRNRTADTTAASISSNIPKASNKPTLHCIMPIEQPVSDVQQHKKRKSQ